MIQTNVNLQPYNTFGIKVLAKKFASFSSVEELHAISQDLEEKRLILGGGSNVLFTQDFEGTVLKNNLKGIEVVKQDEAHYYVKAMAGENWHQFVMHCIEQNYAGIENLSLIPGNIGAAPMQNIGAYGVELKDVFHELEALHLESGEVKTFNNADCEFGYRESVFKRALKNQFVITSVTLKLNKQPVFKTSYGAIQHELEQMQVNELSIQAISQAVINIRQSKLPDPAKIGNAGSFFKNPVVKNDAFEAIKKKHPNVVGYPVGDAQTKLAAGWLIDQAGWKGKTYDNYGVHKNQALVLVNYGDAAGKSVYDLSQKILDDIHSKFGVQLEREVNIY